MTLKVTQGHRKLLNSICCMMPY